MATSDEILEISRDSPYRAWVSAETITGLELSNRLKADESAADQFCQQDEKRPADYSRHISLVSTAGHDRIDVASRHDLDPSQPVFAASTGKLVTESLSDLLKQTGPYRPNNGSYRNTPLLTFTEGGRFTGYCESKLDYTNVVNTLDESGRIGNFATSCAQKGRVLCLSLR